MRTNRFELLRSLLLPLTVEWGIDEVLRCLRQIEESQFHEINGDLRAEERPLNLRQAERSKALSLVARTSGLGERKPLIEELARRFDAKTFLPSVGDIRFFLEMNGEEALSLRQRSDAFKKVLHVLSVMQPKLIDRLVLEEAHNGPSELAPLSAAIRNAAAHRAQNLQSVESNGEERNADGANLHTTQNNNSFSEFIGPPKPDQLGVASSDSIPEQYLTGDLFDPASKKNHDAL